MDEFPWFRLWTSILNDPKPWGLDPEDFRAWVMLLAVASSGSPRGHLPALREVAFFLRCGEDDARATLDRLVDARLIDVMGDGSLSMHQWAKYQPTGGGSSTERVRRHRANKAGVSCNVSRNADETFQKRFTSVSCIKEKENSLNTDTETEGERCGNVSRNADETLHETFHETQAVGTVKQDLTVAPDPDRANLDPLAEEVEGAWPGWGQQVYGFADAYLPGAVAWGFRTALDMGKRGERLTLRRIRGLIEYSQREGTWAEQKPGVRDGRATSAKPKTEREKRDASAKKWRKEKKRQLDEIPDDILPE